MTLLHKPEHAILTAHEEPAVAHITFANEAGMRRFISDNRLSIKSLFERWTMDFEIMLTITANNTLVAPCASKTSLVA